MTANDQHRDHSWTTRSSHPTSDGLVTYQSCPCGRWRILTAARAAEVARSPY
ncbi:MAG TPA: hypothetical protein VFO49_16325 [Nocardioides sp.]|nr:hypothetical protein [Nocardioides sp.]